MRKTFIIAFFTFMLCILTAKAQNYVGMSVPEVEEAMKKNRPDFVKAKVINKSYNYLKYQDALGEQTILFFIDNKDVCTSIKLMSHYVYMGQEVADLNKKYQSIGNNQWTFNEKNQDYIVTLEKGQWFFSIITKKKE